jgi:hypothetical protein
VVVVVAIAFQFINAAVSGSILSEKVASLIVIDSKDSEAFFEKKLYRLTTY